MAATASATQELEAVYRQEGDRLWRALVAFGGDPDLASDAVAEAFAKPSGGGALSATFPPGSGERGSASRPAS